MMRTMAMAIGAALFAGAALAQQTELPPIIDTVPQARFETDEQPQDEDDVVTQPRFVRAPGEGGIEVSPLAPPGEPGDETETIPQVGSAVIDPDLDVLRPRGPDDPEALTGSGSNGGRFRSASDDVTALTRPAGPAVPIDAPPTELRQGVRLRELDKMTGQTETFELTVGETRQVDRLEVRLEACRSPQANDTHGTMAFLKVWDTRAPEEEAFSGWMFAEAPSLSALDHPRYDLWVISCTTSAVAATSPSD